MYVKITRGMEGFFAYQITGKRKNSKYTRNEKDNVIPLCGDLELNGKVEKYLQKNKNNEHNYLHITLSFSKEDMVKLYSLSDEERISIIKEITMEYIKHHTTGYNIKEEVVACAEMHEPIIKEENGKERLLHVHIQIMNYSLISDIPLSTPYAKTCYIDNTLETYTNRKYNFSNPMDFKMENGDSLSPIALARKEMVELTKDFKNIEVLKAWLSTNQIDYKHADDKYGQYIVVTHSNGEDVNIIGKGFEHFNLNENGGMLKKNQSKSITELKNRLEQFYKNRVIYIEGRRSKKSREALAKIEKDKADQYMIKEDSISSRIHQDPTPYAYNNIVSANKSMGYTVQKNKSNHIIFKSKEKDIKVEDKDVDVTANNSNGDSLGEKAQLMLEIVTAKGWRLLQLDIQGSTAFRAEIVRQIFLREKITQSLTENDAVRIENSLEKRPRTVEEKLKLQYVEKKELEKAIEDKDTSHILKNIDPQLVLDYAIEKYKLNADNYKVTHVHKINNLTNEDESKNVIYFFKTEVHLSVKEAIAITKELFKNQKIKKQAKNIRTRIKM